MTGMDKASRKEAFRKKFGREPEPGDPIFFDPDAETPQQISEEDVCRELNREAAAAGVAPAFIYAMNKTGMILTAATKDLWSKEALAEWDAAIEEYCSLISKRPS